MIIPVEISYHNTAVETGIYGGHDRSSVSVDSTIAHTVQKFFPWLGWFEGKVSSVEKTRAGTFFTIKYEDNNSEHWFSKDFSDYSSKTLIPIGGLGFWFIGTFQGYMGYLSATEFEILDRKKRVCKFCDRESKNYTLVEIESFYRIEVYTNDEHTSTPRDDDGDCNDDSDEELNLKSDTSSSDIT